jgi:hypothetical protein
MGSTLRLPDAAGLIAARETPWASDDPAAHPATSGGGREAQGVSADAQAQRGSRITCNTGWVGRPRGRFVDGRLLDRRQAVKRLPG